MYPVKLLMVNDNVGMTKSIANEQVIDTDLQRYCYAWYGRTLRLCPLRPLKEKAKNKFVIKEDKENSRKQVYTTVS